MPGMWTSDMTRRLSQRWRVVKSVGLVVCVLILAAWGASLVLFVQVPYGGNAAIALRGGGVLLLTGVSERGGPMTWHVRTESGYGLGLRGPYPGLTTWRRGGRTLITWWPLWPVFLAAAVPTTLLWWRDRRYPKGHCQTCGYDLTGNTSGVCPECGEKARDD